MAELSGYLRLVSIYSVRLDFPWGSKLLSVIGDEEWAGNPIDSDEEKLFTDIFRRYAGGTEIWD